MAENIQDPPHHLRVEVPVSLYVRLLRHIATMTEAQGKPVSQKQAVRTALEAFLNGEGA